LGLTTLFFFGVSLMTSPPQKADQFISELEEDLREEGFVRSGRTKG